ncbi:MULTISPECIES: RHS repeat-associated core domain-containing protein [unclassified Pseudomonas]|uniref:RHS repeat-associated core domain-containing protein n=1 Tax=unclassified Pseudomonas TaxID=196821 RepID=UPI00128E1EE4|nr:MULTISPECIES: RHS repeat-associated core domain-containing protein [unclassified Pseudomonas]MPQ71801.1 toxin [Pseudomonas sp. MWU12-2323]
MSILTGGIHTHTPTLSVIDPRGLAVRVVAYCRSVETEEPEERINRSAYDAMGRLIEQWDPRLWSLSAEDAATPANLTNAYSLSGKVLGSTSVDAGKRVNLFGDGDQLVQTWDSRGSERWVEYDDLLRPLAIFEQGEGDVARCTERHGYADAGADFAAHNQCGQLIRHDDPAGTLTVDDYALTGGVLEQTQRFLSALESPDWPQGLPERDVLLEPMEQAATSATYFNPLGDVLEQIDAKGNRQLFDYTVDGQLLASHLQLSGQVTPQTLVSAIAYSAYVQVEQETAGNGVVSTLTYRPEDGRLIRLQARHGTEAALQDLHYEYDPVGNVLSIEDAALPIRYFANQRVEPVKRYDYDSLYQLIEATGWEAGAASRGPGFNRFDDPGAVANYHQTYRYDAGGNLLELVHVGPQNHSRKLTAARYSNRCLLEQNGRPPTEEEIAAAFDGNGNLLDLQPGQAMSWDLRNQLCEVRPVERENADDDLELYLYDGDGMRQRKVRTTQTNARSLISEVRYLPGLEIRTHEGTGEVLQVICVQAGRSAMQVLHWETAPPSGIANNQYRYNLTDHLGSSSLELDSEAQVISQETYHPFGSTAWFAGRSEVEASYKTVRYSGKEQDTTGLYYYGFRYYAPWLQRWINPDPAGTLDGPNVYRMVSNSPLTFKDEQGYEPVRVMFDKKDIEGYASIFASISEGLSTQGVSPAETLFILVGRSPLVLGAYIEQMGLRTANLQISGLAGGKEITSMSDLSASEKKNRFDFLDRSLGEKTSHDIRAAVVIDTGVTGSSAYAAYSLIKEYYHEQELAIVTKMAIISNRIGDKRFSDEEQKYLHHEHNVLRESPLRLEERGVKRYLKIGLFQVDKGLAYVDKFDYKRVDVGDVPNDIDVDKKHQLEMMMSHALKKHGAAPSPQRAKHPGQLTLGKVSVEKYNRKNEGYFSRFSRSLSFNF